MKIVFLENFLGECNIFSLEKQIVTKALEIKMTWGKTVYSCLKQSSALFWQLYSQAFFRDHWLLKQGVMDG